MTDTLPGLAPAGSGPTRSPDPSEPSERTGSTAAEQSAPNRRRWPDAGLGLLFAGAFGFIASRPLVDNSFLTHLATGRILLHDGYPTSNPFLYSSTDFPMPSWWWSGVLALVDELAGGTGIRILTALLAGLLGLLVVRLTRPEPDRTLDPPAGRPLLAVIVPAVCVLVTLMPFLNARPQLPGYLLLAVAVLVIKEQRSPWWLVPVFATWLNVHGTWFYGLAVVGLLLAVQIVDGRRFRLRHLWCGIAAVLGVVVGGALSPEPFRLVGLPFEQFGDDRARQAISAYAEWKPAGWGHPLTWMLIAMGLVAVYGAVRARRWGVLVGSIVMVAMGLSAGRLLPLAAITLVPWVASGLSQVDGLGSIELPQGRTVRALGAVGVALAFVGLLWTVATPAYDLSTYPVAAVDWLAQRDLAGHPDVKVATQDYVGNYMDWRFGDRANTFVDDRPGVDAVLDYAALKDLSDGWQQALDRTDADVVVWESDLPLSSRLTEPDWYRAGDFGRFTVFCRSSIADRCR